MHSIAGVRTMVVGNNQDRNGNRRPTNGRKKQSNMQRLKIASKPYLLASAAMAAVFAVAPVSASAVTFNSFFSGNAIQSGTVPIEGFDFTSGHFHIIDTFGSNLSAPVDGNYLGIDGPSLGLPVTMSPSGGGTFSLSDFMGNGLFAVVPPGFPNATSIELTGNVHGGGTLTDSFILDGNIGTWQNFVVGWNNLDSVTFSGNADSSIAIDTINTSVAPEPTTLSLAGLGGLAALAVARRRK